MACARVLHSKAIRAHVKVNQITRFALFLQVQARARFVPGYPNAARMAPRKSLSSRAPLRKGRVAVHTYALLAASEHLCAC
jgi:hypothetical protein